MLRILNLRYLTILVGVLICPLALAGGFTYNATITVPPDHSASPAILTKSVVQGHRLSGSSEAESKANKVNTLNWANAVARGFSSTGTINIECGPWGSYASFFMPTPLEKNGNPVYMKELFTSGLTCQIDSREKDATFFRYDKRTFAGTALERYVLTGYLEPRAHLIAQVINAKKGTATSTYDYQPENPLYYKEEFTIVSKLPATMATTATHSENGEQSIAQGQVNPSIQSKIESGEIFNAIGKYIPKNAKPFTYETIQVKSYKQIHGNPYPSEVLRKTYIGKIIGESSILKLASVAPTQPVTLGMFLKPHTPIVDDRLGFMQGKDVNYNWAGTVPSIARLKQMYARSRGIFSVESGLAPIVLGIGILLIIGGFITKFFTKGKNPTGPPTVTPSV